MLHDWIPRELVRENVFISPSQPREAMLDPLVEVWLVSNIEKAIVPIIHFQNKLSSKRIYKQADRQTNKLPSIFK